MNKYVLTFLLSFCGVVGLQILKSTLASDEARIAGLLEDMVEGFNEGKVRTCLDPLADSWNHEGSDADRKLLADGLRGRFLTERDPRTRALLVQVEVPETFVTIEVEDDLATLEAQARFMRMVQDEWRLAWHVRFHAELQHGDDGWEIVRSRHEDLQGWSF